MIEQIDSAWWLKLNATLRYCLVHFGSKALPLYIVNEYPKSGGSWLGEMLSETIDIPFPRNRLPIFNSCIMHGHMKHTWNMHNVVVMWRDGRDILVSEYYHSLIKNDKGNSVLVDRTRAELCFNDYQDIKTNLPAFMEYVYDSRKGMTWPSFVDCWKGKQNIVYTSYESLKENCNEELFRILLDLGIENADRHRCVEVADQFSFNNMAGRNEGDVNSKSFLRKGIVGDWKNHFSPECRKLFQKYAGHTLVELGYEQNSKWSASCYLD